MCTSPITVYPKPGGGISFSKLAGCSGRTKQINCGQCVQCGLGRESDWAIRIMHEALFYEGCSWFVTNTMDPEHCFPWSSVSKEVHQLYIKRCRHAFGKVRYFAKGEYGSQTARAHYHYALFGPDLTDLQFSRTNKQGHRLYTSKALEALWPFGFVEVSPLDFGGASYLARYVSSDKSSYPGAHDYVSPDGEVTHREAPFFAMSRRPGIGRQYFEKYGHQLAAGDGVVIGGRKRPAPGYYERLLEQFDPVLSARLKAEREAFVESPRARAERRPERLLAKAVCLDARLALGKRGRRLSDLS